MAVGDPVCYAAVNVIRFGRYVSIFSETHMAVCFALQCFRRFDDLDILNRLLFLVLPLGLFFTLVTLYSNGSMHYQASMGLCIKDHATTTVVETVSFCFFVSVVAYVALVQRAFAVAMPGSVVSGNFRRALVYPANFFITYALMLFVWWTPGLVEDNPALFWTATTLERLNGFLNTCAYFLQSRYAKGQGMQKVIRSPTAPMGDTLTFMNDSGSPRSMAIRSCQAPYGSPRLSTRNKHNSRVEFGGVDIVDVAYIGAEAKRQSEMELMKICKAATEISRTWDVIISRPPGPGGPHLGIRLDFMSREEPGYPVLELTSNGLAKRWCDEHPADAIEVGDFIFSVNGKQGSSEMALECRTAKVVIVKVSRPVY